MTRAHVYRAVARGLLLCLALATCKTSAGPDPTGRLLAVTISGTGTGSVTGTGIDCPSDCSETLEPSSSITLTETPGANSTFGGWSHDCTGNNPNTTFTIGPNPRCDARFDQAAPTATLSVAIDSVPGSPGKVSGTGIDCGNGGTDCTESYPLNTTTTLTVTHPGTSSFAGWGGDCLSFASNVQITLPITANKSCTARFAAVGGGIQARGAYAFGYRVEAGALTGTKVLVAGYDNPAGQIIDVSNVEVLQSPPGAEFSSCSGARGAVVFFSTRPVYNHDVFFAPVPMPAKAPPPLRRRLYRTAESPLCAGKGRALPGQARDRRFRVWSAPQDRPGRQSPAYRNYSSFLPGNEAVPSA